MVAKSVSRIARSIRNFDRRPRVTDEHGREPLLASESGRAHYTAIQKAAYGSTRPCIYSGACPDGQDQDTCQAARSLGRAAGCPSSRSPHAVRRGSITHWLQRDDPSKVVGDRANFPQDILDEHYDRRSPHEKMEQRRRYLDNS